MSQKIMQPQNGFQEELLRVMSDDLNISKALALVDEMIVEANETLKGAPDDEEYLAIVDSNLKYIEQLLGISGMDPDEYFRMGFSDEEARVVEEMIVERHIAKQAGDYKKADELRDALVAMDVKLIDTPRGTSWESQRVGPNKFEKV